jgi:hypothetical protein
MSILNDISDESKYTFTPVPFHIKVYKGRCCKLHVFYISEKLTSIAVVDRDEENILCSKKPITVVYPSVTGMPIKLKENNSPLDQGSIPCREF